MAERENMASPPHKDYHSYVIENGELVGKFEEMYVNCENPWPEDIEDLESRLSGTAKSVGINFLGITGISEDSKAGVVVDIKPGSSPWLRIWPEYELSLLRSSAVEGE